jgi:hypothetical protein
MKKFILPALALAFAVSLTSCGGGGLEKDVRKGVKLDCEIDKLEGKEDEESKKKLADLEKQKDAYEEEMISKYKDKMGDKDFMEKAEKIEEAAKKECK